MVFLSRAQMGSIPDNIPISELMLNERYGRLPHDQSRDPYTCGLTGKTYSSREMVDRVNLITRGLSKKLCWVPNSGSEWDKTAVVFSINTIDTMLLFWAIHQLEGVVALANPSYSADELKHQLLDCKAKALFTCAPLLPIALEAAAKAGFSKNQIYLIDVPQQILADIKAPSELESISQIAEAGKSLPPVQPVQWAPGRQLAGPHFCAIRKGVMISHRNVIANILQTTAFEQDYRDAQSQAANGSSTEVGQCLLPQSHIYSLVVVCHCGTYRGDQTVVLPKFDMTSYLASIQRFKITSLFLVPPVIINMMRNQDLCSKYDLRSVKSIFSGAAPLAPDLANDFLKIYPDISIRLAYGLTETACVVSSSHPHDIWLGSSGSLFPEVEVRIMSPDGLEITSYNTPGELLVRSPSVALGYLNNEKATKETFEDGWMRTGDEAVVRVSPSGCEHIFIVDRIKELIKVKGLQVAPAELEACLLAHPDVADCAVVGVPDETAGEVPKAVIVKSPSASLDDEAATRVIIQFVEANKARHKWLKGGVRPGTHPPRGSKVKNLHPHLQGSGSNLTDPDPDPNPLRVP
ncbi:uncharacterized protein N7477_004197 [Penicillium maclennaniae]|uniref:uncharacterized protein n=1 Tax=Penicillium maclennaniae TaxID=1343394 RepID=UPI00253F9224|nr:uncharacterized protein N7477_004197 [Penicillium maclennaniae]KAJ5678564.1 hypothetical protein N7477_004197 [Penicillium maclennaniae]